MAIPENRVCCGSPSSRWNILRRDFTSFLKKFQKVVSICAGCGSAMKNWYPKFSREVGKKFEVNIFDFNEFLIKYGWRKNLMDESKLRASYHELANWIVVAASQRSLES